MKSTIKITEKNWRVTEVAPDISDEFGIVPGMQVLKEISTKQCQNALRKFLKNASNGKNRRSKFTIKKQPDGTADILVELLEHRNGALICSLENADNGNEKQTLVDVPLQVTDEFVHQFRNTLTGILTGVGQLIEYQHSSVGDDDRILLQAIKMAAEKQKILLDHYHQLYSAIHLQPYIINLQELLTEIISENQSDNGKRIEMTSSDIPLEIKADLPKIKFLLTELIKNALEADNNNNINISLASQNSTAVIKIYNECECSEHEPKQNFAQPFFTTKNGHYGLGLPIALRYVSAHNGMINIKKENNGILVEVSLPLENKKRIERKQNVFNTDY